MRVTPPVAIGDAQLLYSNIPEPSPGEVIHSLTTGYLAGDKVIGANHREYTSLRGARATVTISIAAPAVVTWPAHGFLSGTPITLTTTGALPGGTVASTVYYALVTGVDTFNLATGAGGAALATTGSQSGVHTASSSVNLGHALPVLPEKKNDWWEESGTSNRWSALDLYRSTKSRGVDVGGVGSIYVAKIAPGVRCNTISVLGIEEAQDVTIQVERPGGEVVYSYSENLVIRQTLSYYMYSYAPFETRSSVVRFDLPPFVDAIITVTVSSNRPGVKVGSIIVGTYIYIGDTQLSAESDSQNYSIIERDEFSNIATLTPRRSVPKTSQQLKLDKRYVNRVYSAKEALNARPALWTGLDDTNDGFFNILMILGIYKKFSINVAQPGQAIISLELEEV